MLGVNLGSKKFSLIFWDKKTSFWTSNFFNLNSLMGQASHCQGNQAVIALARLSKEKLEFLISSF